jgi:hypothetical protein
MKDAYDSMAWWGDYTYFVIERMRDKLYLLSLLHFVERGVLVIIMCNSAVLEYACVCNFIPSAGFW